MPNTREKLVELLKYSPHQDVVRGYKTKCSFEEATDWLIARGVTIPGRCKDCAHWSRNEVRDTEFGVCGKIRKVSIIKHENGFCDKWRAEDEL